MSAEDNERLEDYSHVDDSQLKLPELKLEKVDVKTMEEDEEVLYKQRCRLFRYDLHVHTGAKIWKERGTGEVKLLRHKANGKVRLLMRQEKTLKICANHIVDPATVLGPHSGSDRAWVFHSLDFAEEELKNESFAIMFRDAEVANEFKAAHENARRINSEAHVGGAASSDAGASAAAAPSDDSVPVANELSVVYGNEAAAATARYAAIKAKFVEAFGSEPSFYVRAPGRVNIIGEHIDYHGYAVLPMALVNDVVIACQVGDASDTVEAVSTIAKFGRGSFSSDPSAPVERHEGGPSWFQYVQCGYKGFFEASGIATPVGMKVLVDGTVPPAAGVSSSSALVVAATLATAVANEHQMTRTQVADAAVKCERYIGTMGGGMDQSISCLAQRGTASVVRFNPTRAESLKLPADAAFVVAHSKVDAAKAVAPHKGYNLRVTEGKLAIKIIGKKENLPNWKTLTTILELQRALNLARSSDLVPFITKHLHEEAYSKEEVAKELEVEDINSVFQGDPKAAGVAMVLSHDGVYELAKRTRHVATEADRVEQFAALCKAPHTADTLRQLGDLMNASQTSCRDDYECSCPELDKLTALALESGAVGSRLTGAGWGGCSVSLVPADKVPAFMETVRAAFFASDANVNDLMFASAPSGGIAILMLSA